MQIKSDIKRQIPYTYISRMSRERARERESAAHARHSFIAAILKRRDHFDEPSERSSLRNIHGVADTPTGA